MSAQVPIISQSASLSVNASTPAGFNSVADKWDASRWPHFSLAELSCRHCGEMFIDVNFLDCLQTLRHKVGKPLHILSGHRCANHNAMIGGAPLSQHLTLAADINLYGHNRFELLLHAQAVGFTGFGFYTTFLHIDLGRPRYWYSGQKAKLLWQQP